MGTHSRRRRRVRHAAIPPILLSFASAIFLASAVNAAAKDLASLSIEDLMEIEVTSPSKRAEPLAQVSAAIYVITEDEIRRSGMTSIPELLRLVPGLHVAQIDSSRWAVTSRGFNSQFANKLLVLIDGRTVYTHLFSGVFWDVQDVMLEDIERIEVVRGPGGTLWGANAVNGVVNIITKNAKDTQGLLATGGGGTVERAFGHARYGVAVGDTAHVRGYVKYLDREELETDTGDDANDQWDMIRGGFRFDWEPSARDSVQVQGDYYSGRAHSTLITFIPSHDDIAGGNILGRWQRTFSETSELSLQSYFDRTERDVKLLLEEDRNTFDVELQHRFGLRSAHDVIWGVGYRLLNDDIRNTGVVFDPDSRTDHLVSGFLQDKVSFFGDQLQVTVGTKLEHNDYSGFEYQPSIRGRWKVRPQHSVWAAISRAVRTPSRSDDDVNFLFVTGPPPMPTLLVLGHRSFDSEKLLAYEVGYRSQPTDYLSFDVTAYYNDYDDIRTTEIGFPPLASPPFPPGTLPAFIKNKAKADGYGVEVAANWKPTLHWSLAGSYTFMQVDVDLEPGATDLLTEETGKDTPLHQFQVRSHLNLPQNFEFDSALYWVDAVSNQGVSAYTRVDVRLGWQPTDNVELSIVGQNLAEGRHPEFGSGFFSTRSQVPRSMYGKITFRY